MNALIREFPLAGAALLRLLEEREIPVAADIARFRDEYVKRLPGEIRGPLHIHIDLRHAAHNVAPNVVDDFLALLRIADHEIDECARELEFLQLFYPEGPGLIPVRLVELHDRPFASRRVERRRR